MVNILIKYILLLINAQNDNKDILYLETIRYKIGTYMSVNYTINFFYNIKINLQRKRHDCNFDNLIYNKNTGPSCSKAG